MEDGDSDGEDSWRIMKFEEKSFLNSTQINISKQNKNQKHKIGK